MPASRPISWLPLALFLGAVFVGLCVLTFTGRGHQNGRLALGVNPAGDGAPTAEYFVDASGARTFDEVRTNVSGWRRATKRWLVSITPGQAAWVRVTLRNPSAHTQHGALLVGDTFEDVAEAWLPEDGGWRHERSGEKVPGREKPWWGRDAVFPVELPARSERVVYLRITDEFELSVTAEWWPSAAALHAAQIRDWLAEGLYFGGLLALLTYNVILWFRLRATDIGLYVLYLSAITVFMALARALPSQWGWVFGSPGLETAIVLAAASAGFFMTAFAGAFLDLKTGRPGAFRVTRVVSVIMGALVLGGFTIPWTDYGLWMRHTALVTIVVHVLLLAIAVGSWRAGVRQARFFVLSFGCLFAGSLPLIVSWLYFNLDDQQRSAGLRGMMIGSALEMLMLSLAIADRFVQAQRDRAAAQQQVLEEITQRQTIQEAYADELEVEVRERTRELEAITVDKDRMIMVLGHDLRGPLTGLTQAAEQLAGDPPAKVLRHFVDEAAATGRQLLLLIEDLVLWVRLRGGGKQVAACRLSALIAPAMAVHRGTAQHGAIELVVNAPEEPWVETDLVPVQTLVRNLIDNAVKHARRRVEVAATIEGGEVRLCVRDDGPGLPADVAAWLADENSASWPDGRGLGLKLCSEISAAMGLRLETRSAPGGGTEFSIRLKAAAAPAGASLCGQ
jgi:signal transduction histidine kinase